MHDTEMSVEEMGSDSDRNTIRDSYLPSPQKLQRDLSAGKFIGSKPSAEFDADTTSSVAQPGIPFAGGLQRAGGLRNL